jgi:hypothetical protein
VPEPRRKRVSIATALEIEKTGLFWIFPEPAGDTLKILGLKGDELGLGFSLRPGTTFEEACELAECINRWIADITLFEFYRPEYSSSEQEDRRHRWCRPSALALLSSWIARLGAKQSPSPRQPDRWDVVIGPLNRCALVKRAAPQKGISPGRGDRGLRTEGEVGGVGGCLPSNS